jgi:hypothetical protein
MSIDNLGIVAEIIDEIGIVNIINQKLGIDSVIKNYIRTSGKSLNPEWIRNGVSSFILI